MQVTPINVTSVTIKLNTSQILDQHKGNKHEEHTYSCQQCDFGTSRQEYLTYHQKLHEEAIYECDKCDYIGKKKTSLSIHNNSKHRDLIPCKQCQYRTHHQARLQKHHRTMHIERKYGCYVCDFKSQLSIKACLNT